MKINSYNNEILKKGFESFSIRGFGYGFGFLFTWLIAKEYGSEIQGIFSISFLFLSVGAMVSKIGVETSIVKWIANNTLIENKKNIYFKSLKLVLFNSVVISTLVFFLAPVIASMYSMQSLGDSIRVSAIAIPFLSLLDVSSSFFKGEKKTTTYSLYFHLAKFLAPLVLLLVFSLRFQIFNEAPILSYLLGLVIVSSIILTHIYWIFRKTKKNNYLFSFKFMISESYPMMISSAIVMIMGWSDIFILGFFKTESEIGVYSVAVKLATIVSFIYTALATIVTPKIASLFFENNIIKLQETVGYSSKVIFLCGIPIFLVLFIFPEFFLGLFGTEYLDGVVVFRILLLAQLTNTLTGVVGPIFQMTGNQKILQKFILWSLILNLIISLSLVSFLGSLGVAFGSAIGMAFWNIVGAWYIYKKMNIKTWI